jgi:hypothetical protein
MSKRAPFVAVALVPFALSLSPLAAAQEPPPPPTNLPPQYVPPPTPQQVGPGPSQPPLAPPVRREPRREREHEREPPPPPRHFVPPPPPPPPSPRDEPPPVARGFQMAVRTGLSFPLGDISGEKGDGMSHDFATQIPLLVELGAKVHPMIFLGAYTGLSLGGTSSAFSDAQGCGKGGRSCLASTLRIGFEVQIHFQPAERVNPWIGYGIGVGQRWRRRRGERELHRLRARAVRRRHRLPPVAHLRHRPLRGAPVRHVLPCPRAGR